jgi:hypothetical protein
MELVNVDGGVVLEILVMCFQVVGVTGLVVSRLSPARWAEHGRLAFVLAMIGLGVSGALLGAYDSEFALFAGLTMTVLLVGLTLGGPATEPHHGVSRSISADPAVIG